MKKGIKFCLLMVIISGLGICSYYSAIYWPSTGGPYRNPTKWHLIFEDEFEGTSLNLSRWSYNYPETSYNGGHTHNHEGYMTAENVLIENGLLRIKGENRRHPNAPAPENSPWGWLDYNYTTGAITSHNKFNFTYGYIEGRFKMPASKGFWPAFWLLNDNGPWPPEIDVLETLMHDPTSLHVTFHYNPKGDDNHQSYGDKITNLPDLSAEFHTYAVEWSANAISWYFDGQKVGRYYFNHEYIGQCENMYLLINLAIGGWEDLPDSTTIWPGYYDCDWIRIWQQI
jgi:beta-glucanase (GH16 family)